MEKQDLGIVWKDQKQLRRGYTTGSCSAAAAKAAAGMLLGKEELKTVSLKTPAGLFCIWKWKRSNGRQLL